VYFSKILRASPFIDDLSNEPYFGRIHLAGQYLYRSFFKCAIDIDLLVSPDFFMGFFSSFSFNSVNIFYNRRAKGRVNIFILYCTSHCYACVNRAGIYSMLTPRKQNVLKG
jgi:hypothetical protein